jgi:hypothetical protein
MKNSELLIKQSLQTYERISRRLETALNQQRRMPSRASRTTAYAALQGRINRLQLLQTKSYIRHLRRQEGSDCS